MTGTDEQTRPAWAGPTTGLLTVAWLVALGVTALNWVSAAWAATSDERPSARWFVAVLVGGPILLAATAIAGKLWRTAMIFGALAVVLAVVVGVGAARNRPPEPVPAPTHCVEFSGGDTRCPGG